MAAFKHICSDSRWVEHNDGAHHFLVPNVENREAASEENSRDSYNGKRNYQHA